MEGSKGFLFLIPFYRVSHNSSLLFPLPLRFLLPHPTDEKPKVKREKRASPKVTLAKRLTRGDREREKRASPKVTRAKRITRGSLRITRGEAKRASPASHCQAIPSRDEGADNLCPPSTLTLLLKGKMIIKHLVIFNNY